MNRLLTAHSKKEIVAIVGEYVRDWDPDETDGIGPVAAPTLPRIFNQTERFVIDQARTRLAALGRASGSLDAPLAIPVALDAIAFDVKLDKAISRDVAPSPKQVSKGGN